MVEALATELRGIGLPHVLDSFGTAPCCPSVEAERMRLSAPSRQFCAPSHGPLVYVDVGASAAPEVGYASAPPLI